MFPISHVRKPFIFYKLLLIKGCEDKKVCKCIKNGHRNLGTIRKVKKDNITFSQLKPWVTPLHPVRRTVSRDRGGRLEVTMAEIAEFCTKNIRFF